MKGSIKCIVSIACLLLATHSAKADQNLLLVQDSVFEGKAISFDSIRMETYRQDSAYNYDQEAEYEENVFSRLLYRFLNWISDATGIRFGYGLFQVLKYLLIGMASYLVIRFFLSTSLSGLAEKKIEEINSIDSTLVDADMSSVDLSKLIEQAEERKDFRLALRFNYLKLLRNLDDKQLIHWKAEKTNSDFIQELKPSRIKSEFIDITRLYEYVWYGEFELSTIEEYQESKKAFDSLFNTLSS